MKPKDMQPGKCYKRNYKNSTYLFKVESLKEVDYYGSGGFGVDVEKSIGITNLGLTRRATYFIAYYETVEEIDESILDKLIKMYDMCKTSMLDTINQDKTPQSAT